MCPKRRRVRRELLSGWLLIGGLLAPACRLGYDELAPAALGGSSGTGATTNAGATIGGSGSGSGGSATNGGLAANGGLASNAGQGAVDTGGSPTSPLGGQPTSMTGGAAGDPGTGGGLGGMDTAGAAGGGAVPGCQDTADCTCAADGGHSYWFCTPALNHANAELQCETQGMHLVRIDSQSENDFLLSEATARGVIVVVIGFAQIGADDLAVPGEWRWYDGTQFWQGSSSGAAVGGLYAHWANASPGNGAKPCAGMLPAGTWQDRSCTALGPFICESP